MKIIHGDCLEKLKELPENSIDSIVTDPPYGLSFMGKKWDYDVPSVEIWSECLRVLKPGGHLLSFAGSRTYHRMAVRIEDAGFEIRDMIAWVYSSGFPKSLNVFKQLKKNCTCGNMEAYEQGTKTLSKSPVRPLQESDLQEAVNSKEEQGEVLQPSVSEQSPHIEREEAVAVFQFPERRKESSLEGRADLQETKGELQGSDLPKVSDRVFSNGEEGRLHNATQASNGTTPREVVGESGSSTSHRPQSEQQQYREPCAFCKQHGTQATRSLGVGTALKPSHEPITVARKPLIGTVAENVLKWGTGGINIDESRVENTGKSTLRPLGKSAYQKGGGIVNGGVAGTHEVVSEFGGGHDGGRFPANLIHDGSEEVLECFPNSKSSKGKPTKREGGVATNFAMSLGNTTGYEDEGSAARFFKACSPTLEYDSMSVCKHTNANNVELALRTIRATIGSTAPSNVEDWLDERLVQNVKSAGIACQRCAISIAQELAKIRSLVFKNEGLLATQDFIGNFKSSIPILNLASIVAIWESIDTTPTTQNLSQLFGSVLLAIDESISSERKEVAEVNGEPKRLGYFPKASKKDRDEGLDCTRTVKYNGSINPNKELCKEENMVAVQLLQRVISEPELVSFSIGESGVNIMAQCQSGSLSTIKTTISKIIESKILNLLTLSLTSGFTEDASLEKMSGGSHAESVGSLKKWLLTITNGQSALALGASDVALKMLLQIRNEENWNQSRNIHSTVKPTALMRYLVKLVTPPGGTVLDPFTGSGSTGKACKLEGFEFIGIEREEEYVKIAEARIAAVTHQPTLV